MFLPRLLASLAFFALSAHANTPEEWKAFLIQNAKKQGVITLPSGLQYSVINKGEGIYIPTEDSPCSFHYHGSHIDGRVFDSTVYRGTPATFSPNQVSLLILCRHSPALSDAWNIFFKCRAGPILPPISNKCPSARHRRSAMIGFAISNGGYFKSSSFIGAWSKIIRTLSQVLFDTCGYSNSRYSRLCCVSR